ncbi:MAG: phage major capsid protein [Clostridia bacterium]|nr:phage major capsid protein [Clostridia bacterium]
MTNQDKLVNIRNAAAASLIALATDKNATQESVAEGIEALSNAVKAEVSADMELLLNSKMTVEALAERGIRQLTAEEEKFFNKLGEALKESNFKAAIDNLKETFPETTIEDVFREIQEAHPLLDAIDFQYTGLMTKWILSDHATPTAAWGPINGEIVKEISGAFRVVNLIQAKLSAFCIIPLDMIRLGARYIERYMRGLLVESIANGLEYGIVQGTGKTDVNGNVIEPIGMIRKISRDTQITPSEGYPIKTPETITSFSTAEYARILSILTLSETGKLRQLDGVIFICNAADYLSKVMPATTMLLPDGTYRNNIFPYPTQLVTSNQVPSGKAIVGIAKNYFMGMGSAKTGTLDSSDHAHFIEDERVIKIITHGMGTAYDDTSFVLLDISNLAPLGIPVSVNGVVKTVDALFNVSVNVEPKGLASVTVKDANNVDVGTCTVDTETGAATIPMLKSGKYTLTASVEDESASYESKTVVFNISNADVVLSDIVLVEE